MNKIDFKTIPWNRVADGGRDGRVKGFRTEDGRLVRILEFSPKWNEKDWCKVGHVGYVLKGKLSIKTESKILEIGAGKAFSIPGEEIHKAFSKVRTQVFIVNL